MDILSSPSSLFESIIKFPCASGLEKRHSQRTNCLLPVNFVVKGQSYSDSLKNLSREGACIHTSRSFSIGAEISLELPPRDNGKKVVGDVVWVGPEGIGVRFRVLDRTLLEKGVPCRENQNKEFNLTEKEAHRMGKIQTRKLRWEPAAGDETTKYKLYWSENGKVDYSSNCAEVGGVTQLILPDDIPSFPRTAGNLELGIAAVNQAGNESDITKISAYFDFSVPEAPKSLMIEDL